MRRTRPEARFEKGRQSCRACPRFLLRTVEWPCHPHFRCVMLKSRRPGHFPKGSGLSAPVKGGGKSGGKGRSRSHDPKPGRKGCGRLEGSIGRRGGVPPQGWPGGNFAHRGSVRPVDASQGKKGKGGDERGDRPEGNPGRNGGFGADPAPVDNGSVPLFPPRSRRRGKGSALFSGGGDERGARSRPVRNRRGPLAFSGGSLSPHAKGRI